MAASPSPWNSLEVWKLVVSALAPVAVALLGWHLSRLVKRLEHDQWRNQRLIEKRIAIYDDVAPELNDLLCYFTFVGLWKELTPPQVIALKRKLDKKIYLAAPLFPPDFLEACSKFLDECYSPFQGWGLDAKLRTPFRRRQEAAGAEWRPEWDSCFSEDPSDAKDVRRAYQRIMNVFSRDIALTSEPKGKALGQYPTNIK